MSTNLNYKQVANVSRRTWDLETYEKKAKIRQGNEEAVASLPRRNDPHLTTAGNGAVGDASGEIDPSQRSTEEEEREEFLPATKGAMGPTGSKRAFLKARKSIISDIDTRIGKTEMVSVETAIASNDAVIKSGIGWFCKVCDCVLKDSLTYLDHINGKKHQRKLGFSMRVERSTKEQVMDRLQKVAQRKNEEVVKQQESLEGGDVDYHEFLKAKDEALQRQREEKRKQRRERKQQMISQTKEEEKEEEYHESSYNKEDGENNISEEDENNEEHDVGAGVDPSLAAMMGFSGFGGGKKC